MLNRKLAAALAATVAAVAVLTPTAAATAGPPPIPYPQPPAQPRIIGGYPSAEQAPVVALYDGDRFLCGATLIAPDSVLTAGHCASTLPSTDAELTAPPTARDGLLIRAGSPNRTEGQTRQITQVGLHQDWNWAHEVGAGDIAVLHLDTPIPDITPAPVGSPDPTQPVRVLGWGLTQSPLPPLTTLLPPDLAEQLPALPELPTPQPPTMLNEVDLWTVNPSQCPPVQPGLGPDETCLTAERPLADTCNGDSGTPGFQGEAVVAIVSRGTDAALPCGLSHTVATDPGHYTTWIADTIAEQRAAA